MREIGPVTIRTLHTVEEFGEVKAIEDAVWQDGESTPASLLKVFADHGGLVLGAYAPGGMAVGMAVAFPGRHEGVWYLHSHMMAILPAYRSAGIGRLLKERQVAWAREHGCAYVGWTFDPMQARNAVFNLRDLHARVMAFEPDYYGVLGDVLNGSFPSHRFFVTAGDGSPVRDWRRARRLLPIPADIAALRREDPVRARQWADAYARLFARWNPQGCVVLGLARSPAGHLCYVIGEAQP